MSHHQKNTFSPFSLFPFPALYKSFLKCSDDYTVTLVVVSAVCCWAAYCNLLQFSSVFLKKDNLKWGLRFLVLLASPPPPSATTTPPHCIFVRGLIPPNLYMHWMPQTRSNVKAYFLIIQLSTRRQADDYYGLTVGWSGERFCVS